jgi:hypothetical protein
MPSSLAETAPRQKPALLLRLYEFLLRAGISKAEPASEERRCQRRANKVGKQFGKSRLPPSSRVGQAFLQSISGSNRPFEERCELCRCPELGNRIELLECARERIGETPCRPRSEFLDARIEIEVMDAASQMLGDVQLVLDESPVDNQLCGFVWNARCFPSLDLFLHRLEVPLNPVDSDGEHVDKAEVFRVLRQHRSERARDNVSNFEVWPLRKRGLQSDIFKSDSHREGNLTNDFSIHRSTYFPREVSGVGP